MTSLRQRVTEDMQVRNLAPNTQKSYVHQISMFARHFGKSPEGLGPADIRSYQVYRTNEKKLGSCFDHHRCVRSPLSLQSYTP